MLQTDKQLHVCPSCANCGVVITNQPRALCAINSDRQWLVVHSTERAVGFDIYKLVKDRFRFSYEPLNWSQIPDTGQSAEDVLREFLEGRGE